MNMLDAETMPGHSPTSLTRENATQSKIPNSVLSGQDLQAELPLLTLLMPELHTEAFNISCAHKCSDHKLNQFSGLNWNYFSTCHMKATVL
jgi:hypothetical protein